MCWLGMTSAAMPLGLTDRIADKLLEMTNNVRARQKVAVLHVDPALTSAARRHSRHMAQFDFFDHTSPVRGETDVEDRVSLEGGRPGSLSENIYWSRGLAEQSIPASIYREWMDSPEHREAMLSSENVAVGIGVFRQGSEFWATAVFSD